MILLRAVSSADGAVVTGQINIKKIYVNGSAAATVTLKDGTGTVQWQGSTAAAADLNVDFADQGLRLSGHQFSTVTAATIYIYG